MGMSRIFRSKLDEEDVEIIAGKVKEGIAKRHGQE